MQNNLTSLKICTVMCPPLIWVDDELRRGGHEVR